MTQLTPPGSGAPTSGPRIKRLNPDVFYGPFKAWERSAFGSLPRAQADLIAVAVSRLNQCQYCLTWHAARARRHGGDVSQPNSLRAAIEFAERLTVDQTALDANQVDEALDAGHSVEFLRGVVELCGVMNFANRMHDAFGDTVTEDRIAEALSRQEALASGQYRRPASSRAMPLDGHLPAPASATAAPGSQESSADALVAAVL